MHGAPGTTINVYNGNFGSQSAITGDSVGLGDSTMAGTHDVTGNTLFVNATFSGATIHMHLRSWFASRHYH